MRIKLYIVGIYYVVHNLNKILTISIILVVNICFSQELSCDDFKSGKFYIDTSYPLQIDWIIEREGNTQIEIYDEISQELKDKGFPEGPKYLKIQWIDNCNYKLFIDESKEDPEGADITMKEAGGLLVEMEKIEGNCFYYTSSITIGPDLYVTKGKICPL